MSTSRSCAGIFSIALALVGCSDDEDPDAAATSGSGSGAAGATGGEGGAGASGGAPTGGSGGQPGPGGSGGAGGDAGSGGGGGGQICGGLAEVGCGEDEWCDFPQGSFCGGDDSTGVCTPKPDVCSEDCPGICGCDGQFYCNACVAQQAGVDESDSENCNMLTCSQATDAIAAMTAGIVTCSTVVRLDYSTLELLGFDIQCGAYATTTEASARAAAQADTGYGQGGVLMSGPAPEDAWVFYESPGDFGGAAAVNARSGLTAFGGSIVWNGAGDITYPLGWMPPSQLGVGCPNTVQPPQARGFDLADGTTLTDAEVDAALDVVWNSALPAGLMQGGYVFDAVVLLYPRSVGVFDPSTAEWIVVVNSGYLE